MSEALRKVLVAEDEEKIARLLCDSLRAAQFDPVWVADGTSARIDIRRAFPEMHQQAAIFGFDDIFLGLARIIEIGE